MEIFPKHLNGLTIQLKIIFYTAETDTYGKQNGDYFSGSKDFYIYYFRINDRQTDLVWKISDFVKDCEFDIETHFIDDVLSVTDLNENGIPEIWTMYRFGCKSDVSPLAA